MGEAGRGWRLTTAEKKRILLNNIYGVDIDAQAVEVTKLSLLLKVLEGESGQLTLGFERVLPDLGENIKCGNSLIGSDYYEGQQMGLGFYDEEEEYRVNAFNWKVQFHDIFAKGGFDAVIGNPPWGANFQKSDDAYFRRKYSVAQTSALDSYALFIEKGFEVLCKNGLISFITPDTFLRKSELLPIRSLLLTHTSITELIETGPVFSKVRDTWCLVFTTQKSLPTKTTKIRHRKISRFVTAAEDRLAIFSRQDWASESVVHQRVWLDNPSKIMSYLVTEPEQAIIDKIESWPKLGELSDNYKISRGEEGSKFALNASDTGNFFMVIPKDVERYFVDEGMCIDENSLTPTKKAALYEHPKIWIIRIQKMRWKQRIVCSFDERTNSSGMKTLQLVISMTDDLNSLKFLSAILASKLVNFWCINYLADDMNQSYLSRIPIRLIDFSNPTEKAQHDKMVALVENMLEFHKRAASAKTPQEKEMLARQIESTDGAIDRLVYELYGLTEEEIKIVES